jgi:hypothetical protein
LVKADKRWDAGKVSRYQKQLGLTKHGALIGGSIEVMIASLAGVEADPAKIGTSGDGIRSLQHAADVLNEFFGFSVQRSCVDRNPAQCGPASRAARRERGGARVENLPVSND